MSKIIENNQERKQLNMQNRKIVMQNPDTTNKLY